MFDFFTIIFQKVLAGIGVGMIFIGTSLSVNIPPATEIVSTGVETTESTKDTNTISNQDKPVVTDKETSKNQIISNAQAPASRTLAKTIDDTNISDTSETIAGFEIVDVKFITNEDATTLTATWKTTTPARSRIELDGETHESTNGVSDKHLVSITGLSKHTGYKYKITARTQDENQLEDDIVGTYVLIPKGREYYVEKNGVANNCQYFSVLSASNKVLPNHSLELQITYKMNNSNSYFSASMETIKTNSDGVAKYCSNIVNSNDDIKYRITSDKTGELNL